MKVDIVITWVDPHNKEWMEEKQYWYKKMHNKSYNATASYRSFDEIRYCFRSIETYMPWYNHIYLVTNDSAPGWLSSHPRLTVIHYRELMPNNICTYNSNAIESMLHKIPNLTDYFLYFNDDTLLLKPLDLSHIIDLRTGKLKYPKETDIILSNFQYYKVLRIIEQKFFKYDTGVTNARINSIERMGLKYSGIVSGHTPKILHKKLCSIFNNRFKEEIDKLMLSKFRTEDNFTYVESFIHYHINKKIAIWNTQTTRIFTIMDNKLTNNLQKIITKQLINNYDYLAVEDARKKVNINEEKKITDFLKTIYHKKCSFEI